MDNEKKTGRFTKGNKAAVKKDVKEVAAEIALSQITKVTDNTAIDAARAMLANKDLLDLSVQQVIKLLELIAPYEQAKKKEEAQEERKLKLEIVHAKLPDRILCVECRKNLESKP